MKTPLGHLHWNRPTTSKVFTLYLSMSNYFLRTLYSICTKLVKIADAPYHHHFLSCSLRWNLKKKKKIFNLINSILFMLKIRNRGHTCELLISKIYFTKRNETSATERLALVFQLHRHFAKWVWNMSEILTYTLIQFILYKSIFWHCYCLLFRLG